MDLSREQNNQDLSNPIKLKEWHKIIHNPDDIKMFCKDIQYRQKTFVIMFIYRNAKKILSKVESSNNNSQ